MAEPLHEENWTDERCQAWVDDFEAKLKEHLAKGGTWAEFSEAHVGTVPAAVGEYTDRQRQAREEQRQRWIEEKNAARAQELGGNVLHLI